MRHDQAQGEPMFRRERLAIMMRRKQNTFAVEISQRYVGRESLLGVH
jgi:hypothetical protein